MLDLRNLYKKLTQGGSGFSYYVRNPPKPCVDEASIKASTSMASGLSFTSAVKETNPSAYVCGFDPFEHAHSHSDIQFP